MKSHGTVNVVIGAGSIGQAIVRRVSAGKHVLLADSRPENAKAAADVRRPTLRALPCAAGLCVTFQDTCVVLHAPSFHRRESVARSVRIDAALLALVRRRRPPCRRAERRPQRRPGGRFVLAEPLRDDDAEAVVAVGLARVREGLGVDEALLPEAAAERLGEPRDVDHG
jgi:NAD(P)-dependent dehydrogenase (short-subunit alcohol dehydrogenase family)